MSERKQYEMDKDDPESIWTQMYAMLSTSGVAALCEDTVFVVPSKRPAPLQTIENYFLDRKRFRQLILISDPARFEEHVDWVSTLDILPREIIVVRGSRGMIPQSAQCYIQAARAGYRYYFRMDDDLHEKTFVGINKNCFPSAEFCLRAARMCADFLKLSLVGFQNTARRNWYGTEYKRTYGLIHGGAHLCMATEDPSEYIDLNLPAYEDVYRSAAHRVKDGAVGRVSWIGLDKRASLRDSSMNKTPEVIAKAKEIILGKFPNQVSCVGTRVLDGGQQEIPDWRMIGRVK